MEISAKLTSKGQITVPKSIRDALELKAGDQVVFHLEDNRAVLAKTPNFLDLAGSVPVPPDKRGASWDEIRSATRKAWAEQAMKRAQR